MAKQYRVTFVELNAKMKDKYPGAYLSTVAIESGTKRKDFVFENGVKELWKKGSLKTSNKLLKSLSLERFFANGTKPNIKQTSI